MENNSSASYSSPDLYLVAFLKAHGCKLCKIRHVGNQLHFSLDGENIQKLVRDYFNNGGVQVLSFTQAIRELRNIVKNREAF